MKCHNCNSCLKARVIDNRLYLVCYLCKKFFYPPSSKDSRMVKEIVDKEECNRLAGYLEFGKID